jgi:hypothetical protein
MDSEEFLAEDGVFFGMYDKKSRRISCGLLPAGCSFCSFFPIIKTAKL